MKLYLRRTLVRFDYILGFYCSVDWSEGCWSARLQAPSGRYVSSCNNNMVKQYLSLVEVIQNGFYVSPLPGSLKLYNLYFLLTYSPAGALIWKYFLVEWISNFVVKVKPDSCWLLTNEGKNIVKLYLRCTLVPWSVTEQVTACSFKDDGSWDVNLTEPLVALCRRHYQPTLRCRAVKFWWWTVREKRSYKKGQVSIKEMNESEPL